METKEMNNKELNLKEMEQAVGGMTFLELWIRNNCGNQDDD